MQLPLIKVVRPTNDDHLYVMQGGVSDGENIYFYYVTETADETVTTSMNLCKYSAASGTLLASKTFENTTKDAGEPYYHGNDMAYNPNTKQLLVLGYYDASKTERSLFQHRIDKYGNSVCLHDDM